MVLAIATTTSLKIKNNGDDYNKVLFQNCTEKISGHKTYLNQHEINGIVEQAPKNMQQHLKLLKANCALVSGEVQNVFHLGYFTLNPFKFL